MRRLLILAFVAAMALPAAAVAQDASPAASLPAASPAAAAASPAMVGTDTFDVCLSISGPVVEMTPEALKQGIIDGTFTINGLSTACQTGAMSSPGASMAPSSSKAPASSMAPLPSPAASAGS